MGEVWKDALLGGERKKAGCESCLQAHEKAGNRETAALRWVVGIRTRVADEGNKHSRRRKATMGIRGRRWVGKVWLTPTNTGVYTAERSVAKSRTTKGDYSARVDGQGWWMGTPMAERCGE